MTNSTRHNGHDSATTPDKQPAAQLSETEFLAREADDARDAIAETIAQMRASLADAGDVRAWTRRYPWATLGAAVGAGFVLAAALLPSRRRNREDREPVLLERILADEQIAARLKELAAEDQQRPHRNSQMLQSVAGTLWRTFGPAIQSALAGAVAAKAAQEPQPAEGEPAAEAPTSEAFDDV